MRTVKPRFLHHATPTGASEKASLLDVMLPSCCLTCSRPLYSRRALRGLCADCNQRLVPIETPRCIRCGIPLLSEDRVCLRCRTRDYCFGRAYPVFAYHGLVRELLYQYKFQGHRVLAVLFADYLVRQWQRTHSGLTVVPAPPRPGVKRRLGWEHVEMMAGVMERRDGVPVARVLRRAAGTPQKALGFRERSENLRGAISLRKGWSPQGLRLVLMDDLITTGATADECSRVLLEAGACGVDVLAVAIDY